MSAAGMIKRLFAATTALLFCVALGSCSSFSGFVSDTWPTWAGGMPKDVPPRPGAPGYEEFIAQQGRNAAPAAASAATGTTGPAANAVAPATPVIDAKPQAAPSGYRPPNDQTAVQGGLY